MADIANLYPPSPPDVPADLTIPKAGYRLRVVVVLASLFVFALLYIFLVAGSAYLSYWAFASLGKSAAPASAGLGALGHAFQTEDRLTKKYNQTVQERNKET